MSKSITETRELIAAIAALIIHTKANLADGKMSVFEIIGYAKDIPALRKGLDGIGSVPSELLDLQPDEAKLIGDDVAELLVQMGLKHRTGDITEELIQGAADITRRIVTIVNLPPVPSVVP